MTAENWARQPWTAGALKQFDLCRSRARIIIIIIVIPGHRDDPVQVARAASLSSSSSRVIVMILCRSRACDPAHTEVSQLNREQSVGAPYVIAANRLDAISDRCARDLNYTTFITLCNYIIGSTQSPIGTRSLNYITFIT